MASDPKPQRGRSKWFWIALVVALPLVAFAERSFRDVYARFWSPTAEAEWIWLGSQSQGSQQSQEGGVTFFAYRDFELLGFPGRARLSCQADEDFLLYVNDVLVGVGRYRDGADMESFEVGYLLKPGLNRLTAELRSGRGAGGFLLDLEVEGRQPLRLGTDTTWNIVRDYHPKLLEPGAVIDSVEPPFSWSTPPVGRWGLPKVGTTSRTFQERVLYAEEAHAPLAKSDRTAGAWAEVGPPTVSSPPLGRIVSFDFGREVVGFANVVFGRSEGAKALVFTGLELPELEGARPDIYLLNPVGRKSWSDALPRRFRYLTIFATAEMVGARVTPLDPRLVDEELARAESPEGVFGLRPVDLRPPVENEIRGELERLAGPTDG